jgi:hypothetical protein
MFFISVRSHVSAREKKPGELIRRCRDEKKRPQRGFPTCVVGRRYGCESEGVPTRRTEREAVKLR